VLCFFLCISHVALCFYLVVSSAFLSLNFPFFLSLFVFALFESETKLFLHYVPFFVTAELPRNVKNTTP
jgi:hypothetical protein